MFVSCLTYPSLLLWFTDHWRPMEFPPQADPSIVRDVYNGRVPLLSSRDSYTSEKSLFLEQREKSKYASSTAKQKDVVPTLNL